MSEDNYWLPKRLRIIHDVNVSFNTDLPNKFYPFRDEEDNVERLRQYIKDVYEVDTEYVGVQDGYVIYKKLRTE